MLKDQRVAVRVLYEVISNVSKTCLQDFERPFRVYNGLCKVGPENTYGSDCEKFLNFIVPELENYLDPLSDNSTPGAVSETSDPDILSKAFNQNLLTEISEPNSSLDNADPCSFIL
ncbi:hypothetical protein Trydic_g7666 [Trypoxylus dichotomus]